MQDIQVQDTKDRLKIEVRGDTEEKFYVLKSLKRVLPSVIVKVRKPSLMPRVVLVEANPREFRLYNGPLSISKRRMIREVKKGKRN